MTCMGDRETGAISWRFGICETFLGVGGGGGHMSLL